MKYKKIKEWDQISESGLKKLQNKSITIVGLGGTGSKCAEYLVRMGIPTRLIDNGRVENKHMDRMSLFTEKDLGKFKANQAKKALIAIDPSIKVKAFNEEITNDSLFMIESDLVIECSGQEELSKKVAQYCQKKNIPLVYATVSGMKSIVFNVGEKSKIEKVLKLKNEKSVLPMSSSIAASIAITQALKVLLGQKISHKPFVFNAWEEKIE